ncbi:MAG: hypothetical protein B7Z66_15895 [Chromatiales bacterium 21-64-14]|nr:MAG: hypothetical protein B7Z66_15895 [Chromatiales bacterium 21-64-14]
MVIPRRRCDVLRVAAFPWNGWQLSHGISGCFRVEWVAGLLWNQWQDWRGIRTRRVRGPRGLPALSRSQARTGQPAPSWHHTATADR